MSCIDQFGNDGMDIIAASEALRDANHDYTLSADNLDGALSPSALTTVLKSVSLQQNADCLATAGDDIRSGDLFAAPPRMDRQKSQSIAVDHEKR